MYDYAPTPARIVYTAARSLGMIRGLTEEDALIHIRYKGAGTMFRVAKTGPWAAVPLQNYYVEISYPERGIRVDTTTAEGRQVHAVAGDIAWDEKDLTPEGPPAGKSQTLTPNAAADRSLQLAMTPYGAIKAAHANLDKLKITTLPHGIYVLTFPYRGEVMKVTLDRNRRPARVETSFVHPVLGRTTVVDEYSDYKDYEPIDPKLSDEPYSDLFFPAHIVHKLGDRTVLDVHIATCWCVNPYVTFPIPGQ